MKKSILPVLGILLWAAPLWAADLSIGPEDLRIEQRIDGGFHLFIRKKPDVHSVLLVESTKDPLLKEDNYAYRAPEWNAVNGDETRILDGGVISKESGVWSIIDSSPESHPELGEAFHLYIPWILNYGYEHTRHGEIYVVDGAYFNIRAFALPYGDYRGDFKDNPYTLTVVQRPLEGPPEENYMKETVEAFKEISSGKFEYSKGSDDLVDKIRGVLEKKKGRVVDIVLCLDTTRSMRNDIDAVRKKLIPMLEEITAGFASFRIGMVLYKDYFEEYLNKVIPFTDDFSEFQQTLNAIRVSGGRDLPEAVYEALYEAAARFPWESESRLIILIGDAPPHPRQRGKISKEMVNERVNAQGIEVQAIILPQ